MTYLLLYLLVGLIVAVGTAIDERVKWRYFIEEPISMCIAAILVMVVWPYVVLVMLLNRRG